MNRAKTDFDHVLTLALAVILLIYKNTIAMSSLLSTFLVNWSNGAFIMTVVFGLVILGLVGAVIIFINNSIKKEQKEKEQQEQN